MNNRSNPNAESNARELLKQESDMRTIHRKGEFRTPTDDALEFSEINGVTQVFKGDESMGVIWNGRYEAESDSQHTRDDLLAIAARMTE